jgi:hypothetical protein
MWDIRSPLNTLLLWRENKVVDFRVPRLSGANLSLPPAAAIRLALASANGITYFLADPTIRLPV